MNFWGWVCNAIDSLSTPEDDARHHELMVEYGIEEPTLAEKKQDEWEDTQNYLDHMPIEKDVWYDGEFTGYYQFYRTDQYGRRWVESGVYPFYTGYQGRVEPDDVVYGELVVEELYKLYELSQGKEDEH